MCVECALGCCWEGGGQWIVWDDEKLDAHREEVEYASIVIVFGRCKVFGGEGDF